MADQHDEIHSEDLPEELSQTTSRPLGMTLLGSDGTLRSRSFVPDPTQSYVTDPALQDAIAAMDYDENNFIATGEAPNIDPRQRVSVVQTEHLDDVIEAAEVRRKKLPGPTDIPHTHEGAGPQQDRTPFVGTDPTNKEFPELPKAGKDPMGIRAFVGDEMPRMLLFGAPRGTLQEVTLPDGTKGQVPVITEKAKPAFYSRWPDGTKPEDMHTLKVNIADKVPSYMKRGPMKADMDEQKGFAFKGKELEDVFVPLNDKMENAYRRMAEDFEATYGIKLDIRTADDPHPEEEVQITVMGFSGGHPQLAGVGSFPEAANEWFDESKLIPTGERQYPLDGKQGYLLLNYDYCNQEQITDYNIYDLCLHENGHNFGWVHPHDLGQGMKMSQREAFMQTAMAYTDAVFGKFQDKVGLVGGIVEHFFRRFMHNAPEMNTEPGAVYDLQEQADAMAVANIRSSNVAKYRMAPTVPIINHGKDVTLIGSEGDDILDTDQGQISRVLNPNGTEQRYSLVEGHFDVVKGRAGNNKIIASRHGDQLIEPGPGTNQIHIYESNSASTKTIECYTDKNHPPRDKLILHMDMFVLDEGITVDRGKGAQKDDLIFKNGQGEPIIVLKDQLARGKGVDSITVINQKGVNLTRQVRDFDLEAFRSDIMQALRGDVERAKEQVIRAHEEGAEAANDNQDGHEHACGPTCFTDRIRREMENRSQGNGFGLG